MVTLIGVCERFGGVSMGTMCVLCLQVFVLSHAAFEREQRGPAHLAAESVCLCSEGRRGQQAQPCHTARQNDHGE